MVSCYTCTFFFLVYPKITTLYEVFYSQEDSLQFIIIYIAASMVTSMNLICGTALDLTVAVTDFNFAHIQISELSLWETSK